MSSKDVTEVYAQIRIGALVRIIPESLPKLPKMKGSPSRVIFTADATARPDAKAAATAKARTPRKHASTAAKARTGSGA